MSDKDCQEPCCRRNGILGSDAICHVMTNGQL